MAETSGSLEKGRIFGGLIKDCKPNEAKYIFRFPSNNYKIGCGEKFFQTSLARAFCKFFDKPEEDLPDWKFAVQRAVNSFPNFRKIIRTLYNSKGDPNHLVKVCAMSPGVPCKPMLAKPTKGIQVIFKRFDEKKFTCEFKYDGLRGQLHYKDGEVKIYSRNLENMTEKYPDIIRLLKENIDREKVDDFIADSEIVAFDGKTNKILPFQVLMTRSKKNVTESNVKVKVCLFVFDLIYLNGRSLLEEQFRARRALMWENLPKVEGKLEFVSFKDTDDTEEINTFLEESVKCKTFVEDKI